MAYERDTDPYGKLEYVIGTGDDFWCFDYVRDRERGVVKIHACINSEAGSFIMDAFPPVEVPESRAVSTAQDLATEALLWLHSAGEPLSHDEKGWNQDPTYFARSLHCDLAENGPAIRRPVKMVRRPINSGNYT